MIADKKSLPFITSSERVDVDPTTKIPHVVETVDTSAFDNALLGYLADRATHRFTVGIAAPWPAHEFLRTCAEAIERGEGLELTHADQFNHDLDCAIATDKKLGVTFDGATVVQTDPKSLWSRIVDAYNVLMGKATP